MLRLNVVTGSPLVLSCAPSLPNPCGYFLFTCVQFFHGAGIALAVPATVAHPTALAERRAPRRATDGRCYAEASDSRHAVPPRTNTFPALPTGFPVYGKAAPRTGSRGEAVTGDPQVIAAGAPSTPQRRGSRGNSSAVRRSSSPGEHGS